jgi:hypothetical protein
MSESVEEFLARGGKIQIIERGVSGVEWQKRPNRNIVISKNYDPKQTRKADNQRMFGK